MKADKAMSVLEARVAELVAAEEKAEAEVEGAKKGASEGGGRGPDGA